MRGWNGSHARSSTAGSYRVMTWELHIHLLTQPLSVHENSWEIVILGLLVFL